MDNVTGLLDTIMEVKDPDCHQEIVIDNAPPHKGSNNFERLNEHCLDNGYPCTYTAQASNSPDENVNDLSINQTLVKRGRILRRSGPQSMNGLINSVTETWNLFDKDTITKAFGTLYATYNEVLRTEGDNQFRTPHARVSYNFNHGRPLNVVNINYVEYLRLSRLVGNVADEAEDE